VLVVGTPAAVVDMPLAADTLPAAVDMRPVAVVADITASKKQVEIHKLRKGGPSGLLFVGARAVSILAIDRSSHDIIGKSSATPVLPLGSPSKKLRRSLADEKPLSSCFICIYCLPICL
jgi:hypothetical protein